MCWVYCDIRQWKAANVHIHWAGTRERWHLCLMNDFNDQSIDLVDQSITPEQQKNKILAILRLSSHFGRFNNIQEVWLLQMWYWNVAKREQGHQIWMCTWESHECIHVPPSIGVPPLSTWRRPHILHILDAMASSISSFSIIPSPRSSLLLSFLHRFSNPLYNFPSPPPNPTPHPSP